MGRSRSFVRGARAISHVRQTEWGGSADISAFTTLAAGAAVLDQSLTTDDPETIVRTRGVIWVKSDQESAEENPFGAMGIAIVSDQAAAAGVASVPTPITEIDSDLWMVYVPWATSVWDTGGAALTAVNGFAYEFDSKAMRKISADETVVVVVENASSANGVKFAINFRMLFKVN